MTGYATSGAGPHTGPATRNAPPCGSGATTADLPVPGSMTPTPWLDTYAMRPSLSAPAIGDGLCCGALVEPLHAASTNAAISTSGRARSHLAMSLRTLTRVTRPRFRALLQRVSIGAGDPGGGRDP